MLKLIISALVVFAVYILLGQFYPAAFHTSFTIPATKVMVTYSTAILAITIVLALTRVTVK